MQAEQLEKHFTRAIEEDRMPVLVIDVRLPELAAPVIDTLREAVAPIGSDVTAQDVDSGMRMVAAAVVASTADPDVEQVLHRSRSDRRGVVLVHASQDATPAAEDVLRVTHGALDGGPGYPEGDGVTVPGTTSG